MRNPDSVFVTPKIVAVVVSRSYFSIVHTWRSCQLDQDTQIQNRITLTKKKEVGNVCQLTGEVKTSITSVD